MYVGRYNQTIPKKWYIKILGQKRRVIGKEGEKGKR